MTLHPTLFSFVNRWECDENDHLNVQFYFSRFEEADRQFRMICGLSDTLVGARRVRHVRYHSELLTGDLITVQSGIAFDGPHMLTVVHEIRESGSGALAATAIDGYEPNANSVKTLRQRFKDYQCSMIEDAAPKGIQAGMKRQKISLPNLLDNGAEICFRGTVLPRHIGIDGKADDQFVLSCCTDGVPHVWQRTPMTVAYLDENGFGRVAVEMKLCWHTPLKSGEPIVVATGFTGVQNTTFSMCHNMFEAHTNRLVATLDVIALTMDLDTRAAVPLPEDAHKAISKILMDR